MKRIITFVLILVMLFSILTACISEKNTVTGGQTGSNTSTNSNDSNVEAKEGKDLSYLNEEDFPIVKDKITFTAFAQQTALHGDWNEMLIFKAAEELTNIKFEFTTAPSEVFEQKKSLMFASKELPDIIFNGITISDETKYGSSGSGVLIPLNDLIEEHSNFLKNYLKEDQQFQKSITAIDGNIYALSRVALSSGRTSNLFYISNTWLENVNLPIPKTIDEFYDTLVAFKEKDPNGNGQNDEIPISAVKADMLNKVILPAFGDAGGGRWNVIDGKVIYTPMTDTYKEYLKFINKLYKEKLLDNELFTQTIQDYTAKSKDGRACGILTNTPQTLTTLDQFEELNYSVMQPMISEFNDKQMAVGMQPYIFGYFSITNKCKYPEAAIRWVDIWYRDKENMVDGLYGESFLRGPLNVGWRFVDEDQIYFVMNDDPKGELSQSNYRYKYVSPVNGAYRGDPDIIWNDPYNRAKGLGCIENIYPFEYFGWLNSTRYTKEEEDTITIIKADLEPYVDMMEAKFITGAISFDMWDEYVNDLKKIGIEKYIEINQTAHDRANK